MPTTLTSVRGGQKRDEFLGTDAGPDWFQGGYKYLSVCALRLLGMVPAGCVIDLIKNDSSQNLCLMG